MEVSGVSENSGERSEVIFSRIVEHIDSWKAVNFKDTKFSRLNGLSNACYKVSASDVMTLLYRKFECKVVDKQVEALIFKVASDEGLGPKLLHQSSEYRIEGFLEGRPLTIWEMRNPCFMSAFVDKIFDFHFNQELKH